MGGVLSREDSLKYVGMKVEASRAFRLELRVFSTLGQFVDKLTLTVPQSGFQNLERGSREGWKRLTVLWRNRARNGSLVGTGAYVIKSTLTLLKVPGVSDVETTLRNPAIYRGGIWSLPGAPWKKVLLYVG